MEDAENKDRIHLVQNDNVRRPRQYDPKNRPKIIIGDAAPEAAKPKRAFSVHLVSMVVLIVALVAVGIWIIVSKS